MRLQLPEDAQKYYNRQITGEEQEQFILTHRMLFKENGKLITITVEAYLRGSDVCRSHEKIDQFLAIAENSAKGWKLPGEKYRKSVK